LTSYRAYTGVGSRETPDEVLALMTNIAQRLWLEGWVLRSGAAPGADTAFEGGAAPDGDYSRTEIYLPWEGFELRKPHQAKRGRPQPEAYEIAARFHPAWSSLKEGAKALHARNVHQVLGYDVTKPDPSKFLICWTEGGKGGGGTGQALRIAKAYNVRIFDLANREAAARISAWVGSERWVARPADMAPSVE
jgi:hypothetical protein